MSLPESQWSKDNPSIPRYVLLADRIKAGVDKAVARHKLKQIGPLRILTRQERLTKAKELREQAAELESHG